MPKLEINIPLIPTAQMRARHGVVKGISKTFKHSKQIKNEQDIALFLRRYAPRKLEDVITTATKMTIICYMPMPKSWSGKKKSEMLNKPHTYKLDIDNLSKNIMDVITKTGIWTDDGLVYSLTAEKYYSDKPRWEITLEW